MINAVEALNISSGRRTGNVSVSSFLSTMQQAQAAADALATNVFLSLSMLTASSDNGINREGLTNLKTLIENENLTDSSAYSLVNTMLDRFSALSSDGEYVTQDDFTNTVRFAVAQEYSSGTDLNRLIQEGTLNVSADVAEMYGYDTAVTVALLQFLDTLSEDTVGKIISNMRNAQMRSTIKSDSYYGNNNEIQDYRSVTSSQLTPPFSISI